MYSKYTMQIEKQVLASSHIIECVPDRFLWIQLSERRFISLFYETQTSRIIFSTGLVDSRSNIFKLFKLFVNLDRLRGETEHSCLHSLAI